MAQPSSDVASKALLRCHGVICWSPPEVYLFTLLAARRISILLTCTDGKQTPGSVASIQSVLVSVCVLAVSLSGSFSSSMSMSISRWAFSLCLSISIPRLVLAMSGLGCVPVGTMGWCRSVGGSEVSCGSGQHTGLFLNSYSALS